jgi:hypothetical protein
MNSATIHIYMVYLYWAQAQSTLFLRRPHPHPKLVWPTPPLWQRGSSLGPRVEMALGPGTRAGNNRPGLMCPIETALDHTSPCFRPHRRNPTRRQFARFDEAILQRCHHMNPKHNNSLDHIHSWLCVSHVHYDAAEDPTDGDECIHDSGTRSPLPPWMWLHISQQELCSSLYQPSYTYT